MLAHSHVIAGRPREAQPEKLRSIMAHYRQEQEKSAVCVLMDVGWYYSMCGDPETDLWSVKD